MKRVINGKAYNTETAEKIDTFETSGLSMSDFRYYNEALYKTKKETFFLAGEGHGMTKYGSHNGNTSGWGEDLIILTNEEALKWCEQNKTDLEIIKKHFIIEEG